MNSIRTQRNFCFGTLSLTAALFALTAPFASAQTTVAWAATGGGTAWYGATNWSPARTGSNGTNNWLTTDIAQLNNNGTANTYGVNVGLSSGSAGGSLSIAAIQVSSDRTRGAAIGASVTNSAATLTLNGATLGGNANSILQNSSSNSLTIRDNDSGSGKFLTLVLGNATDNKVLIDSAGGITISSVIQGAGKKMSLISSGTGTLTLSGNNTFDGGFFLNSGVLRIETNSTGGVTALGTGALNVSGGRVGTAGSSVVLTNNISATGDFSVGVGSGTSFSGNIDLNNGIRTVTMVNSATFSGTISNGGLAIKDGTFNLGATGLIQSDVAVSLVGTNSAATLNISNISGAGLTVNSFSATTNTSLILGAKTLTSGGDNSSTTNRAAITGTGGLIKVGSGTVTLGSSSSAFSGGTSLNGGAIAIASDNAFGTSTVTIADGTRIGSYSTQARTISNNLTVNGNFTVGGFNNNTTFNGGMDLGASTRTITLDNSATVGGAVTGLGGLIVDSSSSRTLTLGGNNTYSGSTTVSGNSTLRVNGTLASSSVTVNTGATLGGSGTISGDTTIGSGAFLAPGNSPGLLTFGNNLTLAGEVVMELNGTTSRGADYDAVNVGNLLTYGGKLTLSLTGTYAAGANFNLFDFASTAGSFTSIDLTGSYVGTLANNLGTWTGTVGGVDWQFTENDGIFQAVPEPSTYALIGMAAAAFAGYSIRRRKRAGN